DRGKIGRLVGLWHYSKTRWRSFARPKRRKPITWRPWRLEDRPMANNKEEAGKGMPRPGEMPAARRPYATIDVSATEVEGREPAPGGASKPAASAAGDAKSAARPEAKPSESRAK